MLNRGIHSFHNQVKEEKVWNFDAAVNMRRLGTQTVGLLGFGNIPKLIAESLKPFGVKLIAYDTFIDKDVVKEKYDTDLISLDEVLAEADILSIHLPVNEETRQIMNEERM